MKIFTKKSIVNSYRLLLIATTILLCDYIIIYNKTNTFFGDVIIFAIIISSLVFFAKSFKKMPCDSDHYVSKLTSLTSLLFTFSTTSAFALIAFLLAKAGNLFVIPTVNKLNVFDYNVFCLILITTVTPVVIYTFIASWLIYIITYDKNGNKLKKNILTMLCIFSNFKITQTSAAMFYIDKDNPHTFFQWLKVIITNKGNIDHITPSKHTFLETLSISDSIPFVIIAFVIPIVTFFISRITDESIEVREIDNTQPPFSNFKIVIDDIKSYKSKIDRDSNEYKSLTPLQKNFVHLFCNTTNFYRNMPLFSLCPYCGKIQQVYKVIFEDNTHDLFNVSDKFVINNAYELLENRLTENGSSIDISTLRATVTKPYGKITYCGESVPHTAYCCKKCMSTIAKPIASLNPPLTKVWLFGLPATGKTSLLSCIFDVCVNCSLPGSSEFEYFNSKAKALRSGALLEPTRGLKQSPLLTIASRKDYFIAFRDCSGEISRFNQYSMRTSDTAILIIDPNNLDDSLSFCLETLKYLRFSSNRKYTKCILLFTKVDTMNDVMDFLKNNPSASQATEFFCKKYKNNLKFNQIVDFIKNTFRTYAIQGISVGYFESKNFIYSPRYISELIIACTPKRW